MITEQHIQSAIIGMWRQGATINEIAKIVRMDIDHVVKVIIDYFKNFELW